MPLMSTFAAGSIRGLGQFGTVSSTASSDSNFKNVILLLSGNGTNGSNNNIFLDSSINSNTIVRNANTTQGTFSPYGNNWSNYFDGASDYIRKSGAGVLTGSGDVTIECWIYPLSTSVIGLFDGGSGEVNIIRNYAANVIAKQGQEGTGATFTVTAFVWQHFACTFSAGNIKVYIDGVLNASGTYTSGYSAGSNFDIGVINGGGAGSFNGYISNFRVTSSLLYTTNFAAPTTPLTAVSGTTLLTCHSNRFIDGSTNNYSVTKNGEITVQRFSPFSSSAAYSVATNGGSAYFDGVGDYLNVASGTPLNFGTGNFTVEFWIYPMKLSAAMMFLSSKADGTQTGDVDIRCDYIGVSSTTFYVAGGGASITASFTGNILSRWTHVALVRNGATVTFYLNGVSVGTGVGGTQGTVNLGAVNVGGGSGLPAAGYENVTGYMSGLRIIRGSAQYTSAFTPPTEPPSAVANTSLLLNFTNAGVTDATMINNLETFGSTQISTAQSKYGGSSLSFDGTDDFCLIPYSPLYNFDTGPFTIECWINFSNLAGNRLIFDTYTSAALGGGYQFYWRSTGTSLTLYGNGVVIAQSSFTSHAINTWYHVVCQRNSSGIVQIFVDGTSYAYVTYTTALNIATTAKPAVGIQYATYTNDLGGYINDLRITKGTARYTGNSFVVPATSLPNF